MFRSFSFFQNRQETKKPTRKQMKLHLGWLHRSHGQSRYQQVRMKDGGGVREFACTDDENITVDYLRSKAIQLFFPKVHPSTAIYLK